MGRRRGERDSGKEQLWRRLMADHGRSGLSVREFCEQEGLKESAFYFWRRDLARRDAEPASGRAAQGRGASLVLSSGRRRPTFLPVAINSTVIPSGGDLAAGTIEVRLPEGITLRIGRGVDAVLLGMVLQAVRG